MHGSLTSDSINPVGVESQPCEEESKSDDGDTSNSNPWLHLNSLKSFDQQTSPLFQSIQNDSVADSQISRTSGSSKSSCSGSDDSNDNSLLEKVKSSQPQKTTKPNQHHSDPSHERHPSRQQSCCNESCSRDSSNQSLKRKLSSAERSQRGSRQYSTSNDERQSQSNYANRYKVAVNNRKAVQAVNNSFSASLMIESLIDQICKMMLRNAKDQQNMYKIICNKLYEMGMITRTYAVDELQVIRNHYQKALYQIFTLGRSVTQSHHETEFLLPVPSVKIDFPMSPGVMEVSRYKGEFEELKFLAKGGFGKVYRVRHRLDGAFYAVKKIYFRNDEHMMKSVNEVKMLANLNHPNVVSYKAAWIEPLPPKELETNISSASTRSTATVSDTNISSNCFKMDIPTLHHGDTPESDNIIFTESVGDETEHGAGDSIKGGAAPRITIESVREKVAERTAALSNKSGENFERSVVESKSVLSSSVSNAVQPYRSSTVPKEIRNRRVNLVVLYVQMQLCELTLRQWLDTRNTATQFDLARIVSSGLNIFQQVVRGVEYIHARKIVHHDIKPSNIFVSNDLSLVQVGDFGLSCWFRPHLKHGCNIGTALYAAPEQIAGLCDPKSDIYSLGVVLVEILVPFATGMERSRTLERLRKGQVPQELEISAPAIAKLVRKLIEKEPRLRPTATELLKELQDVERLKCEDQASDQNARLIDELSAKYMAVIESKDKEIFELKKRLQELENSQRGNRDGLP